MESSLIEEKINPQRLKNYWEPIYNPEVKKLSKWEPKENELETTSGKRNIIFDVSYLKQIKKLEKFSFEGVDFSGKIDGGVNKITLRNCTFKECSFRNTEIDNIKFSDCDFNSTTFSLSKFVNCEFRDCKYENIGISGNAMIFENVFIEPKKFLNNVFLQKNNEILKENNTSLEYQSFRQDKTKSEVAKKLSSMKPVYNDIDQYIQSIAQANKFEGLYKIKEAKYNIRKRKSVIKNVFRFLYSSLEFPIIFLFGWISGWGQKIGKSILIGIVMILLYSGIYQFICFPNENLLRSIIRSTEYWFLFGYTKYSFYSLSDLDVLIILLNSFTGMCWFAAIIPSILNKMSGKDE